MARVPLRLAPALDGSPLRRLLTGRRRWHGLVVLAHHRVGRPDGVPGATGLFSASPESLDGQLALLQREADLIGPDELDAVRHTRGRAVLLTFDDGYTDARTAALPVLQARGARAVFFVASGFVDHPRLPWWDELQWIADRVGRPDDGPRWTARYKELPGPEAERYLDALARRTGCGRAPVALGARAWCSWDDVRALAAGGMEIGAHTHDHPVLSRVSPERQRRELQHGLDRLEDETGTRPRWLAYPVGQRASFSATTKRIAAEEGIELAFSSYGGWNPWSHLDAYDVRRIDAPADPARLRARTLAPRLFD